MNALSFRPVVDSPPECGGKLTLYRELMARHHYLKGCRSAGQTLRYVAEIDGRWIAC